MRRVWLGLVLVLGLVTPAAAGRYDATFAALLGVDPKDVRDTTAFELPSRGAYTHLVLGRYVMGEKEWERGYLLRCDHKQCTGHGLFVGNGKLDVLGIVDIDGGVVPFPTEPLRPHRGEVMTIGAPRMKHPVLIVRATEEQTMSTIDRSRRPVTGTQRTTNLAFISLQKATHPAEKLFDETVQVRGVTGAGYGKTFVFERVGKGPLELVVTTSYSVDNSLACLPPPPTKVRLRLGKNRRYEEDRGAPGRAGCS